MQKNNYLVQEKIEFIKEVNNFYKNMNDKRLKLKGLPYQIMTKIINEGKITNENELKETVDSIIFFFKEDCNKYKGDDKERIYAGLGSLVRVLIDFDNNKKGFYKLKHLYNEKTKLENKQINNKKTREAEINKIIKELKTALFDKQTRLTYHKK